MNKLRIGTVEAVARLWNADMPLRQILEQTGRTESSLRKMITRNPHLFNRRRGENLEERVALAQKLWREGMLGRDIAERVGMSYAGLRSMIRDHRERFASRASPRAADPKVKPAKPKAAKPVRTPAAPVAAKPRPMIAAPGIADVPASMAEGGGVTFMALGPLGCKWPVAGDRADTLFCGSVRDRKEPYCAHHRPLAYQSTARAC